MNRLVPILLAVAVIGIIALVFFGKNFLPHGIGSIASSTPQSYIVPPLTKPYTNATYGFSLSMPEDFSVQELEESAGGKTIVLQDSKGNGIQISITPQAEDNPNLTEFQVQQDNPAVQVLEAQAVTIGTGRTGVAFKSDNADFGGASREVWFVFRGNLYQISTYERLDPLLKAMFGTWKFF